MSTEAVIVDVIRTPVGRGKPGGILSGIHPVDLLAGVLDALVSRNDLDPALIDDVIGGCVSQIGEQSYNITRNAVLAAGFPETVPGTTIDRQCGSSQQAATFAAQAVLAGHADIVIACGVESMSRVPLGSSAAGADPYGSRMRTRYPEGLVGQGVSAELVPVPGVDSLVDETVRPATTVESLSGLNPAFRTDALAERFPEIDWRITPGNSSPLTDGASAALIMSAEAAAKLDLRPRARFRSFSVVGSDPLYMLTGVIPATEKALARAGLVHADIDAYEVNEAFASVPLAWLRETGADAAKLNPRGGAIALGHALGSSGTRLLTTLVNHLEATGGRLGLQTMCEGGGMANATVIELL